MNGHGRGGRMPPGMGMQMAPPRRGPPPVNGPRGPPNGYPPRQLSQRPSVDDNLDEFSHVVLYDDIPEGEVAAADGDMPHGSAGQSELDLRERELMLRQRELSLRKQEMAMRRGGGGRRMSHVRRHDIDEDEDDEDDYVDPTVRRDPLPQMDPDNFDMLSVTSKRTRRAPSQFRLRKNVADGGNGMPPGGVGFLRSHMGRNRASARLDDTMSAIKDSLLDNPMMSCSSNRYGPFDRKELRDESRASSFTASRMQELGYEAGPYPAPPNRRTSQSPGNPLGPASRGMGRPSPPTEGYIQPNGMPNGTGRPSPPGGMRAPVARHPPGHGNAVHPQQVEQQVGRGEWG